LNKRNKKQSPIITVYLIMFRTFAFLLCLLVSARVWPEPPSPGDPDMLYEYRIAQLNKLSPIELVYNADVRKYIDLYTGPRKEEMARIIGLSTLYFPIFEEMLDRQGLPLELKYLTVIESGLNPLVTSKSGAVGLWQFLLNTGRLFDLEVTSLVDERCDPYKSTEAACRYLSYLYNTFHDWQLVLSSYNGGPGDVRKAIERSHGVTDYWKLRPYLSEQSKNYVPAFVAAFYMLNFYQEHGIVPVIPDYDYNHTDTLHIRYSVSFSQVAGVIGLDVPHIRMLNPVYKRDYIPERSPYSVLVLPADKTSTYLEHEVNILGFSAAPDDYNSMVSHSADTTGKTRIMHMVQPGEFTHKIAMQYNVTLENIRAWNHLNGYEVKAGQKIVVWVRKE
jgi:membrane-bound lytic murein transglycosylase D